MKARERIIQIVSHNLAPRLRIAGFRETGLAFYRRLGTVVQVIQIQLFASNFNELGHFDINVGLNFDQVCQLEQRPVSDQPKEVQCQFRRRLEQLVAVAPARWEVGAGSEPPDMVDRLLSACEQLVNQLNTIDSLEHFLALGWLKDQAELGLRAQILYLLGDTAAAIRDLQNPFFRSRPDWDFDIWLAQRGLISLRDDIV